MARLSGRKRKVYIYSIKQPTTMEAKITRKQQVANIINWINHLPNFKKATTMLGYKDEYDNEWKYCCLGVACQVFELPRVDFEEPFDDRLIDRLCLRDEQAGFDRRVLLDLPKGTVHGECLMINVGGLAESNDDAFGEDSGFTRQRAFMILTTNRWIANEEVAAAVNKHFAKEREELKRNPLFKLEIKK